MYLFKPHFILEQIFAYICCLLSRIIIWQWHSNFERPNNIILFSLHFIFRPEKAYTNLKYVCLVRIRKNTSKPLLKVAYRGILRPIKRNFHLKVKTSQLYWFAYKIPELDLRWQFQYFLIDEVIVLNYEVWLQKKNVLGF